MPDIFCHLTLPPPRSRWHMLAGFWTSGNFIFLAPGFHVGQVVSHRCSCWGGVWMFLRPPRPPFQRKNQFQVTQKCSLCFKWCSCVCVHTIGAWGCVEWSTDEAVWRLRALESAVWAGSLLSSPWSAHTHSHTHAALGEVEAAELAAPAVH